MKTIENHPWLSPLLADQEEEDSVGEMIRYTLDELRLAGQPERSSGIT